MSSVNKVTIVGNIGNIDIRQNSSGEPIVNISVATSESWKDKSTGEKQQKTEWHKVVLFGHSAKFCSQYAAKGSKVYVEGRLQTRKWTDKQGIDKWTTEIIADEFKIISSGDKPEKQEDAGFDQALKAIDKHSAAKGNGYVDDMVDDDLTDIPF